MSKKVLFVSSVLAAVVLYYIVILPNLMVKPVVRPSPSPIASTSPLSPPPSGIFIAPAVSPSILPSASPTNPAITPPPDVPARKTEVASPLFSSSFTSKGAALESLTFTVPDKALLAKGYRAYFAPTDRAKPMPILHLLKEKATSLRLLFNTNADPTNLTTLIEDGYDYECTVDPQNPRKVTFRTNAGGLIIEKVFTFSEDSYLIEMQVNFTNTTQADMPVNYLLVDSAGVIPDGIENPAANMNMTIGYVEAKHNLYAPETTAVTKLPEDGTYKFFPIPPERTLDWVAGSSMYFVVFLNPDKSIPLKGAFARQFKPDSALAAAIPTYLANMQNIECGVVPDTTVIPAGASVTHAYSILPTPKYLALLRQYEGSGYDKIVSLGFWELLVRLILMLLEGINYVVRNYGVAIIILSIVLQIALHPLTRKQYIAMNKMQKLQPLISEAQKRFKGDNKKLGEVTMAIYQRTGVNPLGGCLPILLQLPVFFALYTAFSSCIELRDAHFLWVADLSSPERIPVGAWAPFGIQYLNILPIVMTAVWFIQSSLSPKPADPQQMISYRVMQFMPLLFAFLFYSMASGLVLYWLVRNTASIFETLWIKHGIRLKEEAGDAGFTTLTLDAILKEQKIAAKKTK
ncbi:MAG: YidC/Oxa1 family insertase periplasmic-domain containing protein [Candidatus Brocadiia bacterium]